MIFLTRQHYYKNFNFLAETRSQVNYCFTHSFFQSTRCLLLHLTTFFHFPLSSTKCVATDKIGDNTVSETKFKKVLLEFNYICRWNKNEIQDTDMQPQCKKKKDPISVSCSTQFLSSRKFFGRDQHHTLSPNTPVMNIAAKLQHICIIPNGLHYPQMRTNG